MFGQNGIRKYYTQPSNTAETNVLLSHPHPLYPKRLNANWPKTRPVADRLITVVHYNKLVHSTMT